MLMPPQGVRILVATKPPLGRLRRMPLPGSG